MNWGASSSQRHSIGTGCEVLWTRSGRRLKTRPFDQWFEHHPRGAVVSFLRFWRRSTDVTTYFCCSYSQVKNTAVVCRWTGRLATRRVVAAEATTRVKINIGTAACAAGVPGWAGPGAECAGEWLLVRLAGGRTCCLCTSSPQQGPRATRPHVAAACTRPPMSGLARSHPLQVADIRVSFTAYTRRAVAGSFITT